MYFKDKHYYIAKLKEYIGLAISAILFDLLIVFVIIMA